MAEQAKKEAAQEGRAEAEKSPWERPVDDLWQALRRFGEEVAFADGKISLQEGLMAGNLLTLQDAREAFDRYLEQQEARHKEQLECLQTIAKGVWDIRTFILNAFRRS